MGLDGAVMQYFCAAGIITWVVCVFVGLALLRADLSDIAEGGGDE